jgi:hypothetical protein
MSPVISEKFVHKLHHGVGVQGSESLLISVEKHFQFSKRNVPPVVTAQQLDRLHNVPI